MDFESEFPTEIPVVKTENTRDMNVEETSPESQESDQQQTANECVEASPSAATPTEQPSNPWITTKCIFCQQILGSPEEPKLLDCLHSACNNCIEAKVRESQLSSESDILCKFVIFNFLSIFNIICLFKDCELHFARRSTVCNFFTPTLILN